jgi:hypothetical protein
MRRPDGRFALWGIGLILLAALPAFAGFAGFGWELAQIAGLAGAIACIALCGAPLRPRAATPPTLISLGVHTLLGWIALIAVALHVGGLLLADHTVIEYLKPTAPLYGIAGICAAALLLVLVLTAGARARRRLWSSHRGFQATHVILGCCLIAASAIHVIATRRYIGGPGRRILWLAATAGALLLLLRFRRPTRDPGTTARSPRLVFGRHSTPILTVIAGLTVLLATLSLSTATQATRLPLLARRDSLPLDFPHAKHVAINCLECHHNYEEGDFSNTCVACHRSARTDLKMPAEPRFHGYCLECHRHPEAHHGADRPFDHHGPVAGCVVCHRPPTQGNG